MKLAKLVHPHLLPFGDGEAGINCITMILHLCFVSFLQFPIFLFYRVLRFLFFFFFMYFLVELIFAYKKISFRNEHGSYFLSRSMFIWGKLLSEWKNEAKRDRFIDHCIPCLIYLETGKYHEKYEWHMKNIWNRYCVKQIYDASLFIRLCN